MDNLIRRIESPSPAEIPDCDLEFLKGLRQPSWIVVPGRDQSRQRMVTTLLHGNEPSGLRAVHHFLKQGLTPAVTSVFYIGSVSAALADGGFVHRSLPGERDANRCYGRWLDDEQGRIAAEFTRRFERESFEALIDIHNNTGHNPAYGIGLSVDTKLQNLVSFFGDWFMHYDLKLGTLMEMTKLHCPSVAVECGRAGDAHADAAAIDGLSRFLSQDELDLEQPPPADLKVLRHPHRVFLAPEIQVGFGARLQSGLDLCLRADLDQHNFTELAAGSLIGWVREGMPLPLEAMGAEGGRLGHELFVVQGSELRTRKSMVPVMMTMDLDIARSDCLFYAMTPSVC